MKNSIISLPLAAALMLSFNPVASAANPTLTNERVESVVAEAQSSGGVQTYLKNSGNKHDSSKAAELRKAKAFADLLDQLDPSGQLFQYYSSKLSKQEIKTLQKNTQGKHYEITLTGENSAQLSLVDGESVPSIPAPSVGSGSISARSVKYTYDCWQAYVAAFSFALGAGLLCVPAGGAAVLCSAAATTMLPVDWNAACH